MLPPGIHPASLAEIEAAFATNARRRDLFAGLVNGISLLNHAGCIRVYLDGSYVTGKPQPGDFDACWDPTGIDRSKLDPVFLKFDNGRAAQKARFKGEFFPSSMVCRDVGATFLEFLQRDRFSGAPKGIVEITLTTDPHLSGSVKP